MPCIAAALSALRSIGVTACAAIWSAASSSTPADSLEFAGGALPITPVTSPAPYDSTTATARVTAVRARGGTRPKDVGMAASVRRGSDPHVAAERHERGQDREHHADQHQDQGDRPGGAVADEVGERERGGRLVDQR